MDTSIPQQLMNEINGSFHFTVLLQKRVRELVRGGRPLYETRERNPIKVAFEEWKRGLISLEKDDEGMDGLPT